MDNLPLPESLDQMITGYCVSQAIFVAAELGIADLLASGPRRAEDLARQVGAHERSLYRLLRALASVGVFAEDAEGRFSLTSSGALLRTDAQGSQRPTIRMMVGQFYEAWGSLLESIRSGRPAFEMLHGRSFFDHLAENPEQAQIFDDAMTARNERKTQAMLDVYDFAGIRVLADIGGGNGSMLRAVLARYPDMRGILFDRPGVIERARNRIEAAGLSGRCDLRAGSFLDHIPDGADAYLLRHIIHNWGDEHAAVILKRVHAAMVDDARLLVIDRIIPPGNDPMFGKIMDLNMLVMLGGVERTEREFQERFNRTGFRMTRVVPTAAEVSLIEAVKAS